MIDIVASDPEAEKLTESQNFWRYCNTAAFRDHCVRRNTREVPHRPVEALYEPEKFNEKGILWSHCLNYILGGSKSFVCLINVSEEEVKISKGKVIGKFTKFSDDPVEEINSCETDESTAETINVSEKVKIGES